MFKMKAVSEESRGRSALQEGQCSSIFDGYRRLSCGLALPLMCPEREKMKWELQHGYFMSCWAASPCRNQNKTCVINQQREFIAFD